ncbi:DUF2993 domain-containing protein [Jatrophihabitans endophyticus]|uniref:LmeA family phospholipid-binding protein n=1 Tax=Jatrophihabitans endophyticus TaxID=1206085 RepID=UPI0019E47AD9|nr:DUF2993 domain-containing protein [Jatrophihabitans endophyticus]MBE7188320.1 DUF2993 domain-containing protein [Jatrophihabitans endophyticus]
MLLGLTLAAVLVLVGLLLVLVDRQAATVAERRASEFLSASFGRPADVHVEGAPFLTQALRGRYRDVRVSGGGLRLGVLNGASLDARLRNVYLSTRRVLGRQVEEMTCEHLSGRIVLPYAELARVAKIPGLQLTHVGGRLLASAALPVAGFDQIARVNGEAVWSVGGGGSVWLRIRGVSVVGIAVPSLVMSQLLPTLNVPIPLPELPFGLRIENLEPEPDGLAVTGSAAAPVFRRS